VDLISHARPKRFVYELVASEAALARKFRRNDARGEVSVVIRFDSDIGSGQAGPDQLCDLFRVHVSSYPARLGAAECPGSLRPR
jgi:hypothetical protein